MYVLMWFIAFHTKRNNRVTPCIEMELCHENILRIRQREDYIKRLSISGDGSKMFAFDDLAVFNNFECAYSCMCELDKLYGKEFNNQKEARESIKTIITNNKEKFNDK